MKKNINFLIFFVFVKIILGNCKEKGKGEIKEEFDVISFKEEVIEILEETADDKEEKEEKKEEEEKITPLWPVKIKLSCKDNKECNTTCGNGKCINGKCAIDVFDNLCLIEENENFAYCYKDFMNNPLFPCLLCNSSVSKSYWTSIFYNNDFEDDESYLITEDISNGGIVWHISTNRSYTGEKSLYFGDETNKSYGNNKHVKASAKTKKIKLLETEKLFLYFALYLETEETLNYDIFSVRVFLNGTNFEIFNSDSIGGTTEGVFIPILLDISQFAGKEVSIEFLFDSIDGKLNSYEGAYVDSIRIKSECCANLIDCDDLNSCTDDKCPAIGGECINQKIAECCLLNADCDDGDSCSENLCKENKCLFKKITACCHKNEDCNDNDPCTEDICPGDGEICVYKKLCCEKDIDCKDEDKCTSEKCINKKCIYENICCKENKDCDDKNKCTIDYCINGECKYFLAIPGCCLTNDECNDNYECTKDICVNGKCQFNFIEGCCVDNSDCNDNNVCTKDTCFNKKCAFEIIKGCCSSDADCNDNNPCTEDKCSGFGGECSNNKIEGCCLLSSECDDKDVCTKDFCVKNKCENIYFCCKEDKDCDDKDDVCTIDKCVNGFCKYESTGKEGCCKEEIYWTDFENGNKQGWIFSPLKNGVGWQVVSGGEKTSGNFSLYYGNPSNWNFNTGGKNSGTATSPEIEIAEKNEILLSLNLYVDVETNLSFDKFYIYVLKGNKKYEIWKKDKLSISDYKKFKKIEINLTPFGGEKIKIEFNFDSVDSILNFTKGIFIDDILIKNTCVPKHCSKDSQCNDGFTFTKETCEGFICKYEFTQ